MTMHLIALHGFLGLPRDWDQLAPLAPAKWNLIQEDLWSHLSDFDGWAAHFCERMEKLEGTKVLIGYSLGGRLALHALARCPDLFSGAVIVSANAGLKTNEERASRFAADQTWAAKFRSAPWPELLQQWNAQKVLQAPELPDPGLIKLQRGESDFDRELLAESLELWSLGFQRDLEMELRSISSPLLFVTGADDTKFTALAGKLVNDSLAVSREHVAIENAGHRAPWDNPDAFRRVLAKFLSRW